VKLKDLVLTEDQLTLIQGIEGELRRRRRTSLWGLTLAGLGGVANVLLAVFDDSYWETLQELGAAVWSRDWSSVADALATSEFVLLALFTVSLGAFLVLRLTRFFVSESEEPFRYTFWIDAYEEEAESAEEPADTASRVQGLEPIRRLLHHDLRERIIKRIPRFSLLETGEGGARIDDSDALSSHVRVKGSFLLREMEGGRRQLQLMSRIRVGPPGSPETLAHPLRLPLPDAPPDSQGGVGLSLAHYEQLVERAYSQVATEIYRRLEEDLKNKIELFPTNYLKAVALYNEAQDLAGSNTVDAYDRAVALFRDARHRFSMTFAELVTRPLLDLPLLWRLRVRHEHTSARIHIGYAKALIYRRLISALAGRNQKPLFEAPGELAEVVARLGTLHRRFHRRSWQLGGRGPERWRVHAHHIRDSVGLVELILAPDEQGLRDSVTRAVREELGAGGLAELEAWTPDPYHTPDVLIEALNDVVQNRHSLADIPEVNDGLTQLEARRSSLRRRLGGHRRLNRLVLDEAFAEYMEEEVRYRLGSVLSFLAFPRDSWRRVFALRPPFALFRRQTELLFEAHVVAALAYHYLGAIRRARQELANAAAVAPLLANRSSLYKLAAAEVEPDLAREITLLRQSLALEPDFEIAQFRLGLKLELQLRAEGVLTRDRAQRAIECYERVLRLNPGNLAALSALGYLYWLIAEPRDDGPPAGLDDARRAFEDILEYSTIVRHQFGGPAHYGLARILAEEGRLEASYDHFAQALDADPLVGSYSTTPTFTASPGGMGAAGPFDLIGPAVLARYCRLEGAVRDHLPSNGTGSPIPLRSHSYVLNDLGNAFFQHHLRTGLNQALEEAIQCYREALARHEKNGMAYFNLHYAYGERFKTGECPEDEDRAWPVLEQAEAFASEWPAGMMALAHTRLDGALARWQKAEEAWRASSRVRRGPEAVEGPGSEGRASADQSASPKGLTKTPTNGTTDSRDTTGAEEGDAALARARTELEEARARAREIISDTKLGAVHKGLEGDQGGDWSGGLLGMELEAGRLDEDDLAALFLWAEVRSTYIQDEESRARSMWGSLEACRYIDGLFYFDSFRINIRLRELVDSLETLLAGDPTQLTPEEKRILGWTRVKAGRVVRDNVSKWLEFDPVHFATVTWVDGSFRPERYLAFLDEAQKNTEGEGRAPFLNLRGNLHYARDEFGQAAACYGEAVELLDGDPIYWSNLAHAREFNGEVEEAKEAYRQAIRHASTDDQKARHLNLMGNMHHRGEEYEVAIECYQDALALRGETPVYWSNLAASRLLAGDREGAREAYRTAIECSTTDGQRATYHNRLGKLEHDAGDPVEAVAWYERALHLEATNVEYLDNLATSARVLGEPERAERAFQDAIEIASQDGERATYWNRLGNLYYAEGSYEEAVRAYDRVLALDDDDPVYWSNRANALAQLARTRPAIKDLEKAISLSTDDENRAGYWNRLGNLHHGAARWSDALECYQHAIELDEQAVYWANVANSSALAGNRDVAERAYRKAMDLSADDAPSLVTYGVRLGNLYHADQGFEAAIACYEEALELDDSDAVLWGNLAGSAAALGHYSRAREAYERAVELCTDEECRGTYRARLEGLPD